MGFRAYVTLHKVFKIVIVFTVHAKYVRTCKNIQRSGSDINIFFPLSAFPMCFISMFALIHISFSQDSI